MKKVGELDISQLGAFYQRIGTGGGEDAAVKGISMGLLSGAATLASTSALFWYFAGLLLISPDIHIGAVLEAYKWTALASFGVGGAIGGGMFAAKSLKLHKRRQEGEFRRRVAEAREEFGARGNWSNQITDPLLRRAVKSALEELDEEARGAIRTQLFPTRRNRPSDDLVGPIALASANAGVEMPVAAEEIQRLFNPTEIPVSRVNSYMRNYAFKFDGEEPVSGEALRLAVALGGSLGPSDIASLRANLGVEGYSIEEYIAGHGIQITGEREDVESGLRALLPRLSG